MKTSIWALVVFLFLSTRCFAGNFEVASVEADIIKRDGSGNFWVNLTTTITNNGTTPTVEVMLKALDKDNRTLKNTAIKGTIPPGETDELIGSVLISESEYKKIKMWMAAE